MLAIFYVDRIASTVAADMNGKVETLKDHEHGASAKVSTPVGDIEFRYCIPEKKLYVSSDAIKNPEDTVPSLDGDVSLPCITVRCNRWFDLQCNELMDAEVIAKLLQVRAFGDIGVWS